MPFGVTQGLTIAKQIPGLGGIVSVGESIFGKHSEYNFVPGKPPGSWRGQAALDDYNARMRALGYTRTLRGGLVVMDTAKPITATIAMPGGAIVSTGSGSTRKRSGGAINRRKRRRSKRMTRGSARRRNVRGRRKARLTKRQLAAGFGGRRRMR